MCGNDAVDLRNFKWGIGSLFDHCNAMAVSAQTAQISDAVHLLTRQHKCVCYMNSKRKRHHTQQEIVCQAREKYKCTCVSKMVRRADSPLLFLVWITKCLVNYKQNFIVSTLTNNAAQKQRKQIPRSVY